MYIALDRQYFHIKPPARSKDVNHKGAGPCHKAFRPNLSILIRSYSVKPVKTFKIKIIDIRDNALSSK